MEETAYQKYLKDENIKFRSLAKVILWQLVIVLNLLIAYLTTKVILPVFFN